tara:strand:+ start:369 stop:995 length:627 start_codon:yes stop_codon:yes gene_type:complete
MTSRNKISSKRTNIIGIGIIIIAVIATIMMLDLSATTFTEQTPSDYENEEYGVIETEFGKMVIRFFPNEAPGHVENFKKLAKEGFYDGTTFHRVIPGFMIQGGDPLTKDGDRSNDGTGGPGYSINAEFNSKPHNRGILSMARSSDPNSAGSQFFIMVKNTPSLDGQYTVFGEVIENIETADSIVSQPRDDRDNPLEKIEMKVSITTNP